MKTRSCSLAQGVVCLFVYGATKRGHNRSGNEETEQNFVQRDGSRHASEPASGAECRPASFEKPPSKRRAIKRHNEVKGVGAMIACVRPSLRVRVV